MGLIPTSSWGPRLEVTRDTIQDEVDNVMIRRSVNMGAWSRDFAQAALNASTPPAVGRTADGSYSHNNFRSYNSCEELSHLSALSKKGIYTIVKKTCI